MKVAVGKIPFPLVPDAGVTYGCTVNCVGVMGAGVAKDFAAQVPGLYADYRRRCALRQVRPGAPYLWTSPDGVRVAMLPTKDHWRDPSRMDWVTSCLDWLAAIPGTLHLPLLGCGAGGLHPYPVYAKIAEMRRVWPVTVYVTARQQEIINAGTCLSGCSYHPA